ncbi:hypothetical protein OHA10_18005 [Kribbella sp. NBC_00662]
MGDRWLADLIEEGELFEAIGVCRTVRERVQVVRRTAAEEAAVDFLG